MIVIGDFNGDGIPDLAVGGSTGIYILIGNGDGSFQAPMTYAGGTSAVSLVVADFNGDAIADLGVATVTGLFAALGRGNGTFAPSVYSGLSAIGSLQVADFNQDGKPDLLFTNTSSGVASIALGNGNGTFQLLTNFAPAPGANAFVVGDFNNDGKSDVAITYWTGVEVFLNQGNGSFAPPIQSSLIAPSGETMIAGDFNGDGKLDIAIRGYGFSNYFNIAFGNGDGTFSGGVTFNTDGYGGNIAAGDFNLDGKPDFAVANPFSSTFNLPVVDIFLGGQFSGLSINSSHTGAFSAGQQGATYQIAVSNPAYASSNWLVSVTDTLPAGFTATAISGTGWNCNLTALTCTRSDALTSGNSFPVITVTVNVSSSLSASTVNNHVSVTGNSITNTATDTTVIVGMTTTTLVVSPGAAALGQAVTLRATVTGGGTGSVTFLDAVTLLGSVPVVSGCRRCFTTYLLPAGARSLSAFYVGDSTHGTSASATRSLLVSAAAANGFAPALTASTGGGPIAMALGDFNGDGKADLVTANLANTVSVLLGNGDGTFRPHADLNVGSKPLGVTVGDFNGDGKQDLAVVNQLGNSLSILLGNGDGTFQPAASYFTGNAYGAGGRRFQWGRDRGCGGCQRDRSNFECAFGHRKRYVSAADGRGERRLGAGSYGGRFQQRGQGGYFDGGDPPYVLLGNGDGTFNRASIGNMYVYATAGFLRNSNEDVLTTGLNSVVVYLGSGTGSYSTSTSYPLTFTPSAVAIADVNGDGFADVIAAGYGSLAVMLGSGDGALQAAETSSITAAEALVVANFNGDSRTDVAIASGTNYVSVVIGILEPALSVASTHIGNFNFNATDYYQIVVTNLGPGSTFGTVTVVDTVPAGLTATSIGGVGWNCILGTVSCTRNDSLGVGASYSNITLGVSVASNATSPVVNMGRRHRSDVLRRLSGNDGYTCVSRQLHRNELHHVDVAPEPDLLLADRGQGRGRHESVRGVVLYHDLIGNHFAGGSQPRGWRRGDADVHVHLYRPCGLFGSFRPGRVDQHVLRRTNSLLFRARSHQRNHRLYLPGGRCR